jgi:hypothetical protein
MDSTGVIRATGFNEQLDKFYETLTIDNVSEQNFRYCFYLIEQFETLEF